MMPTGPDRSPKLVLDTSAYSWLRSGHERVLAAVASAEIVWVPCVVIGELEAGFAVGRRQRENSMLLDEFLAEPFVAIRPVDREVGRHYGRLFAQLRSAGTPIPINDVWIAATTLECGGSLLTFDGHFRKVAGLEVTILEAES